MTMSFPFGSQFSHYSNPGTPRVYSWDVSAEQDALQMSPEDQSTLEQHLQQQQQEQHQQQERVSPSQLQLQQLPLTHHLPMTPPEIPQPRQQQQQQQQPQYTPHPPTISLQPTPSQLQYRFDITTEEHYMQPAQASASSDPRPGSSSSTSRRRATSRPPLHVDTSRASSVASPGALSSAGAGVGPLRAPRGHAQSAHPYRRPQSRAASGSSAGRDPVGGGGAVPNAPVRSRRVSELQSAQMSSASAGAPRGVGMPVVGTAMAVSCPAMDTWREGLLGLSEGAEASHDLETTPTATPRAQGQALHAEPVRRYGIRADIHYSAEENIIIAMFELPGVKRNDLRVTMSVCPFSRVRQLNIAGVSRPALPSQGHGVRERKFGHFARTMVVPPETRPEDISSTLEDGILTMKIPGGTPAQAEPPQEIIVL